MPYPPLTLGGLITTVRQDRGKPVTLSDADRSQPVYLIGKPDKGKSTLMLNMLKHDIETGAGFVFIEPEKNLSPHILNLIPAERVKDVIALDYSDHAHPIPLNPFDGYEEEQYRDQRHGIASALMAASKRIFADSWSATRMQRVLAHTYTACLEKPDTTFLSVSRMFEDEIYREYITQDLEDPHAANFWKQFKKRGKKYQTETGDPIINRIEQLYSNPVLCNILCQPNNSYDLADHIRRGGIIVVNLGRSANGENEANTLGAFLFARLYHTALMLGSATQPFTFYLDDFTEYALPVFPATFSQSPHMRFVLAHQHMGQFDDYPQVRSAVLGSAGTLVVFQVSAADAQRYLAPELDLDPEDRVIPRLTHIPNYHAVVKYNKKGTTETEYIRTNKAPEPKHDEGDVICEYSRKRYATPRAEMEDYIRAWYDTYIDLPPPKKRKKKDDAPEIELD